MKRYDVIIVGSGNAGLVSACTMSQMGFSTLLVEKNNAPGGCAASFVRGRFEFEASLHNLPFVGEGEKRGDIGMIFDRFHVQRKFYPISEALHFIADGPERMEFKAGIGREAFASEAEKACPGCKDSFWRFCELCDQLNEAMGYISSCKGAPDTAVIMSRFPNYIRLASSTVEEMFDALDMPKGLKEILSVFALYQCGDISEIDAARFILMTDSFIRCGAYQTDLRSFGLSMGLVDSARRLGCDIWYNAEVSEIAVKDGRVSGIKLKDGTCVEASQVICNIMPHIVYGRLIKPEYIPPMELKKANARELGARAFCVYLGLDRSYQELGIKDYAVFINSSLDNKTLVKNGTCIETAEDMSVNCLNVAVPNASPEGTCILYLTTMFTAEGWGGVTPENYRRLKNDYARRLIKRYERATGIEISSHIEEISIATPVTYARYLGTPQGSVFGYAPRDWDGMMSRMMGEANEKTIPGLSFVGGHGARLSGFSPSYMSGMLNSMKLSMQMRGGARV